MIRYRGTYPALVPDLVAEVVSPTDTRTEMRKKVSIYLSVGVPLLWMIWPKSKTIEIWQPTILTAPTQVLTVNDILDGGTIMPGFTCPVQDLFA